MPLSNPFPDAPKLWKDTAKIILGAGLAAAVAALLLAQRHFAVGFFVGTLLSLANFHLLYLQTRRAVAKGAPGPNFFLLLSLLRWGTLGLVFWVLTCVAWACLWGAFGAYLFSVLVLGWMGWTSISTKLKGP